MLATFSSKWPVRANTSAACALILLLYAGTAVFAGPPQNAGPAVSDRERRHWSFRPLGKFEPPRIAMRGLGKTPIDQFILARLSANGLRPAPPARPGVLVRRVTFDLTGLPPTPEEFEAFERSADLDTAYAALVDRLLASPHYGERWGRHWLDVARYADSNGYEGDADRPAAYHYRDFVIRALNEDMPFDQFVRRQLAGDENNRDDPRAAAATGFLAAGPSAPLPDNLLEDERQRQRYNELDDMLTTTGAAFLGLSVGCARCHDHKFDPIPTRDYYQMLASLHSGDRAEAPLVGAKEMERYNRERGAWQQQRTAAEDELKKWLDGQRAAIAPRLRAEKIERLAILEAEKSILRDKPESAEAKRLAKRHEKALTVTDDDLRKAMDDGRRRRWDELSAIVSAVTAREPKAPPLALTFKDRGSKPAPSWLFRRGDFHDRAIPVELGFLTVLAHGKPPAKYWEEARASGQIANTTYQRTALAAWMTDVEHGAGPLLARVIVNRIWQHHLGEGLVRTPNDFGSRGDTPSHPDLLEWLAADLVANGWKLKRLHRMIVLSATYRQSSSSRSADDPDNRLLGRMRRRRLEAEALRDALLKVSGTLHPEMDGPAFKPAIPADAMVARNIKSAYPEDVPDTPAVRRRSVYMFHKRVIPYPLLQAFDAPDAQQCAGRRAVTTVAPQALAMLNDPFVRDRAGDFARRLQRECGNEPERCVERAYWLALSRQPAASDIAAGVDFLARQEQQRLARDPKANTDDVRRMALTDYCQALFGLNEFIYVD